MNKKTILRSIRISEEVAELIDRQVGKNFTEKYENLITRCVWELPQKEKQLKKIQKSIDREWQRLMDMQKATEQIRMLENDLNTVKHYLKTVERRAKSIAETAEL